MYEHGFRPQGPRSHVAGGRFLRLSPRNEHGMVRGSGEVIYQDNTVSTPAHIHLKIDGRAK